MVHYDKLHADLAKHLAEYRSTERKFEPAAWAQRKADALNDYMRKAGLKACTVSVSGGVDSAVTLALMKLAQKQENSPIERVLAVAQPIHSSAWALDRAAEACKALEAEMITVDQTENHSLLQGKIDAAAGIEGKGFAAGQLRSYMRTPVGYYVAQLLSQEGTPCIVMGTGNMDEDGYLLYYCKAGDGVVDVQLIADLHKSEVFAVGAHLGVPQSILVAAPSADLWDGQTDEEELGFSYDFIELFTGRFLKLDPEAQASFKAGLSDEARKEFEECAASAEGIHRRNAHKALGVVNL